MKARELISALGEDVSSNARVVAASRLPSRFQNKPGLVNVDQKSWCWVISLNLRTITCLNECLFRVQNHMLNGCWMHAHSYENYHRAGRIVCRVTAVYYVDRVMRQHRMLPLETEIWKQSSRIPIRVFPGPMRILLYVT